MKMLPLVLIGMVGYLSSCKKTGEPLTEAEVLAAIKIFDAGWKQKSPALVDSVLAPAYVYFTQSGRTFPRSKLIHLTGSPEYTLDTMMRSEYVVQLYENTAVVSTRWQGRGVYKEVGFDENQRCSLTLVKHEDKVSILSEHCTPITPSKVFH